ncbi:zinc finger MYM-type protein 1 [Trichonephila clavipes]|nr:zinc finger MYM-type protein 1 [Trichonephila clavipes]
MQNLSQPSEKDIVQSEDISNVQAEKCLENVGFEFEKYVVVGLAFRGTEEGFGSPHNGNFIGALELLAEFDPFIREHIEQRALQPKSLISNFRNKWTARGQSFDNYANMSGRYNDVQAVPKEKNKFANYVPCAAHSLDLVGAE